jgi:arabinogalactan endo-1,4-beta-galactosidase
LRAQKLGMKIMIDFHYSDTWADPGKQLNRRLANLDFADT